MSFRCFRSRCFSGIQVFLHLQALRPVADSFFRIRLGDAAQSGEVHQLIHQCIFWIQSALFRQIANIAGGGVQRFSVPQHFTAVFRKHSEHHTDRRCLACAVGSQQCIDTGFRHLKAQVIENGLVSILFGQIRNGKTHSCNLLFPRFLLFIERCFPKTFRNFT